ncbi:MAG: right-handed parallel beta-helix repeat-containing protein, partial [bacterium]
ILRGVTCEYGRGMGFYFEKGSNNRIEGCTIRNFGTLAAMFGKGVSGADYPIHEFTGNLESRVIGNLKAHHYQNTDFVNDAGTNQGIIGCDIYNTGSGAIVLNGGNRKTLDEGRNFIENCEIYSFNRRNKTYAAGITLYGVGNVIKHCHIYNAPHQGIAIFGNEHLIEYNHLEKLVKDVHDNGAIYMGRNPSERGNIIRYNYFSDIGTEGFKNCGIHLDDGASDVTVKGNVFYKSSKFDFGDILINGGSDNKITNNIFIKGSHALWLENPIIAKIPFYMKHHGLDTGGLYWQRMREDVDITSDPWKQKYPEFTNLFEWETPFLLRNEYTKNVVFDTDFIISKHDFDTSLFAVYEHNLITDKDPGFVSLENEDFRLKEDAEVFEKIPGFEPIPMDSIGTYEDEYRKLLK